MWHVCYNPWNRSARAKRLLFTSWVKVVVGISLGEGVIGKLQPASLGQKSVSLGQLFWKNNRKFGKLFWLLSRSDLSFGQRVCSPLYLKSSFAHGYRVLTLSYVKECLLERAFILGHRHVREGGGGSFLAAFSSQCYHQTTIRGWVDREQTFGQCSKVARTTAL